MNIHYVYIFEDICNEKVQLSTLQYYVGKSLVLSYYKK